MRTKTCSAAISASESGSVSFRAAGAHQLTCAHRPSRIARHTRSGLAGSRPTLEALVQYLDEHGLTARRMRVEELFVPNVQPQYEAYLESFYH